MMKRIISVLMILCMLSVVLTVSGLSVSAADLQKSPSKGDLSATGTTQYVATRNITMTVGSAGLLKPQHSDGWTPYDGGYQADDPNGILTHGVLQNQVLINAKKAGQAIVYVYEYCTLDTDRATTAVFIIKNIITVKNEESKPSASTPSITGLSNLAGGTKLTWGKVSGAAKYRVYIKNGSSWKKLADTAATSYTNKNVRSGKTYTYTVQCLSSAGKTIGSYNKTGWKCTFLSQPKISKITNTAKGSKISWSKITGAAKYRVYIKSGSSWKKLGDTASASLVHTAAKNGSTYTYSVRAMIASGAANSAYDKSGWKHKYVNPAGSTTVISKIENVSNGIKITWDKVSGAVKYRIFVKSGSSWKKLVDTKAVTYTYKKVTAGRKYAFYIRCIAANGKYTGKASAVKSCTYLIKAPSISNVTNTTSGQKITWKKANGVKYYCVFVKNGSDWVRIGKTTGTSLTYKKAQSGVKYSYRLKGMNASGVYITGYSATKSKRFIAAPDFKLSNSIYHVNISWSAVAGASKYQLYFLRHYDKQWVLFKTTTSTSVKDTSIDWGDYTYSVKAVASDGTVSAFYSRTISRPFEEYEKYFP